jgi:hypothetical protein
MAQFTKWRHKRATASQNKNFKPRPPPQAFDEQSIPISAQSMQ